MVDVPTQGTKIFQKMNGMLDRILGDGLNHLVLAFIILGDSVGNLLQHVGEAFLKMEMVSRPTTKHRWAYSIIP